MKIVTVIGTRPEIIRLSVFLKDLERAGIRNIVIYTNQNFHSNLSTIFLNELQVKVDYFIDKVPVFKTEKWIKYLYKNIEPILKKEKPDLFLILGDTNSALSANVAKKYSIPIIHMEAGNRSFDLTMPEEKNRVYIDHISDFLLPYTENSKQNLIKEGISNDKIFVSGNPIVDVLDYYKKQIDNSDVLQRLNLIANEYFLITIHRTENTESFNILKNIIDGINLVANYYNKKLIWSMHPRTKSKIAKFNFTFSKNIDIHEAFDFFDFIKLERNAYMIMTDSGTVQEEASLFKIPAVTIRENTERPETIQCKSNILSGTGDPKKIFEAVKLMSEINTDWVSPYIDDRNFSHKVINFLKNTFKEI